MNVKSAGCMNRRDPACFPAEKIKLICRSAYKWCRCCSPNTTFPPPDPVTCLIWKDLSSDSTPIPTAFNFSLFLSLSTVVNSSEASYYSISSY